METLTPAHVQAALDAVFPNIRIRFFAETTATSQQAADALGCQLGQIVKSLCFIIEGEHGVQPILVLTSGDQRVDDRRIAERYGVGRKRVRVATPEECITVYGYAPGSVPPVGHRTPVERLIDASLARFEQLYAAGGAHNAIFPITLAQLQAATGAPLADVIRTAS
jgi:prolyl-tRNA editing enzyme YbaK/EbsC (Cys-tRNA(Pro) deacylase)